MKLHLYRIDDKREIVLGKVTSVKEGTGSVAGKVMNVQVEGTKWEDGEDKPEKMDISFWNGEKAKLADRVKKANLKAGDVVMIDVYNNDGKYIGNAFDFNHIRIPENGERKERNLFLGTVGSMKEDDENRYYRISMPTKNADKETEWVSISFWNDETKQMADRAKKVIRKREDKNPRVAVVCGANKPYNGKASYSGFYFEMVS